MSIDITTISSGRLSAGISALGAELQYLTDSDGRDLQWNGNPAFWTGRAPILFPVIGLLEGGCYRLDGISYTMPKHGFARDATFDLVQQAADTITFRLAASDTTRAIYPFEFQLDIRFSLADATLTIEAIISNMGDAAMPASFGFHPALRWPLPYGQPRDEHVIRFEHEEPAPVRRIDGEGFLLPEPQTSPIIGNTLKLRDDLFVDDALIFDQLESRRIEYGALQGPRLTVDFADFPTLGVWTKPGAGFVCIEPWQGFSDPVGYAGDLRDKPGIIEIAASASKRLAMHIGLTD
ncbi:aldose 1-epimerase family protein (plasmid) [Sphingomonas paeninsulae]|uniref:Aldose 1-epimerase family protein n=1 Tax=Sphingomonas paeninsulae TaxID=2319844 RepID=A0A494TBN7_SPHPE|nr:aldose 1-epimerase family protein [Sphingomonas paeninsulae]AYJ84603.1 aldose 1-epimerase family protein [Sphingomonas paeninsulae]